MGSLKCRLLHVYFLGLVQHQVGRTHLKLISMRNLAGIIRSLLRWVDRTRGTGFRSGDWKSSTLDGLIDRSGFLLNSVYTIATKVCGLIRERVVGIIPV